MRQVTCIYCRTPSSIRFPREHVIPEAFGKFKNNFTLRCVCPECNSYFGRELELFLTRDSGEALLRLRYGVKPVPEAGDIRNTRVKLTVDVPGPWFGAQIILKADETGTKLVSEQVPQVAFRKLPDGEWRWFTEEELVDASRFEEFRKGTEIRIVGPSEEAMQRLIRRLGELGIPFKQQGTIEQPITDNGQIEALVLYEIDQVILRSIGKIAFNYIARMQGADFVLRNDFDHFRQFVRYGNEPPWKPAVRPTGTPILSDDSPRWRQTNGHLITFGWSGDGRGIQGQVSLFNSITYKALFCPNFLGLWCPLGSGHHFDIQTRTISKLGRVRRVRIRMLVP